MQIILLSGGSGTRLWPLSNDARSKQFLKLLPHEGHQRESMVQRVIRQLKESGIHAPITIATSSNQRDAVISQLGESVSTVLEPSRRDTFPAICLACEYLSKEKGCPDDETVIVMPCDPFTEMGYFQAIEKMAKGVSFGVSDLIVMGIKPTYPSSKYGYIIPDYLNCTNGIVGIKKFIEKPDTLQANKLLKEGALWNGGVFAFPLGYILDKGRKYVNAQSFNDVKDSFGLYPKISFDYEVAEKAQSVAMVPFDGEWKDLGTWNTLTDELKETEYGNVVTDGTEINTHIFNELDIPILCLGTKDLVVAASPDGIVITEKCKSENVKIYAEKLKNRPMYEERRWGSYKVLHHEEFSDGYCVLTKQLILNPGSSISYQRHHYRDETWIIVDGEGILVIDGEKRSIKRGESVFIRKEQLHALYASSRLSLIEIQTGANLIEEDIDRFDLTF